MDGRRVIAVAVIGKYNQPLLFHIEGEFYSEHLHIQMLSHASLDIIEEKRKRGVGSQAVQDMYFGHLISIDDYKTYGYFSNTQTKVIVVAEAGTQDQFMRDILTSLHQMVVATVQNPFQDMGQPICSNRFKDNVRQILEKFNSNAIASVNVARPR